MTLKKAVSKLLIISIMTAVLAGCGGNEEREVSSGTFRIGGTGPLTGESAYYGQEVKNGMELAVSEINEAGGIAGKQVEMNFQDDEAEPEKAIQAYDALKEWGVHMIVGAATSDACIALATETAKDNIFLITPSGTAVDCVSNVNAFQICFSDSKQGVSSAEYIREHGIAKKIAVIYDSSSTYSTGIYESFAKEAKEQKLDIVAAEAFTAENNTDFSEHLQNAKDAGAELVFLPIYYKQACVILKQAADMEYEPAFFGCDGLDGILGVEGFDTALAEGVMLLLPFTSDDMAEAAQTFAAKYEEMYGYAPSQFAANAYDAVYTIKVATEEAGITPDMSASDMCDALIGVMTVIEVEGITSIKGVPMKWDEHGMVEKAPKTVIIKNGVYENMIK